MPDLRHTDPQRNNEHTDPHIIAGYRDPHELEPGRRPGGGRDFRRLTGLLRWPHDALGSYGSAKPVWHCAVRAAPEDRMLSDPEWAQIARDMMHRTGLSRHGEDDRAVRWIAVRHGPDHIHLVAMLARQDGGTVRTWNERYRVRDACLAAERRYGFRPTAPADATADRCPSRAEREKAARNSRAEPPRVTLRRHVATSAAAAVSAEDFFARLGQAGVQVRFRYSTRNPGQVTGYSVSLPGDTARTGGQVWFGGGKLAADLSWPRLSQRWAAPQQPVPDWTAGERQRLWEYAAQVADHAASQIRAWSLTSPDAAADAAWAAGDALRVTAAALGSRVLRQAADGFDRAARTRYGRIPAPSPAGNRLRHAARIIAAYAYFTQDKTFAPLLLIIRLAALAEAVADLREAQQRTHQAQAALRAAGQLRATGKARLGAGGTATAPAREGGGLPETNAARQAADSFPDSLFTPGRTPPAGTQQPSSPPRRSPRRPPPARGPSR